MNLTTKFLLGVVLGVVVVHAAEATLAVRREADLFEADMSRDARVIGAALALAAEKTWMTSGRAAAVDLLGHVTERQSHIEVRWVKLNAETGSAEAPAVPLSELEGSQVIAIRDGTTPAIYSYTPVAFHDSAGDFAIEVKDPLADEQSFLRRSFINGGIAAAVLVVLCAAWIWGLGVLFIGRPISALVAHARRVGRGELDRELRLPQRDEVGVLGGELDRMVEGLRRARERAGEEIEARIQAIEQLRHADRLRTVGVLASGIAHELGTPINVVRGHAQMLAEGGVAKKLTHHVQVIAQQTERMATIIRQLLDFARQGHHSDASARVGAVVEQTVAMLEPLAKRRSVELVTELDDDDAAVEIEHAAFQQVLTNVIMNGLHAMSDGGGVLSVEVQSNTDDVKIHVRDQGSGMTAEVQERMFEPFFTTKDVGEGTGLGLSVAHGIVEDAGGRIIVESELGRGTVCSLVIPRVKA